MTNSKPQEGSGGGVGASLKALLDEIFADERVSRQERKSLVAILSSPDVGDEVVSRALDLAFARAVSHLGEGSVPTLGMLGEVVQAAVAAARRRAVAAIEMEAHFSPGAECRKRIVALISKASRSIDACVFNLTDDRISQALLAAHRRDVRVRVLTETDNVGEPGSDVEHLKRNGIEVHLDEDPGLMHHKFAVIDGRIVVTGSFNWTRSASDENQENVVVVGHPAIVTAFATKFEEMWRRGVIPR